MDEKRFLQLVKTPLKLEAMYIAMKVRNSMEDFHHAFLSDEQMKELNPIIRNAIYSALWEIANRNRKDVKDAFTWTLMMIPDYWEDPNLNNSATE